MIKTQEERAEQAAKGLKEFVATLTRVAPALRRTLHVTEQDDEQVSFELSGYPFTLTWGETTKPSIGRSVWVVQYSLCIWHQTPGNRWSPPEDVDTTLITSQSLYDCLRTAFETVAKDEVRIVLENDGYEQMAKQEAIDEALEQSI